LTDWPTETSKCSLRVLLPREGTKVGREGPDKADLARVDQADLKALKTMTIICSTDQ